MLRRIAQVFGLVFLLLGALGFVPGATQNGHLLGLFHVNPAHNAIHLLTGVVALWAGTTSAHAARTFFRVFGVIYGLVAVLGFAYGDEPLFGFIANNRADAWLHLLIAVVSLSFGFIHVPEHAYEGESPAV